MEIDGVTGATIRFKTYLSHLTNFQGGFKESADYVANEAAAIFGRVPPGQLRVVSHGDLDGTCKAISCRIHNAGCWAEDFILDVVKDEMARMLQPPDVGPEPPVDPRVGIEDPPVEVAAEGLLRGGGGLGSGVSDFRETADRANRLVADVQQVLDEARSGAKGVELTVGPLKLFGVDVPAIPLTFKLK